MSIRTIYTICVGSYNVKFTKEIDGIRVSIPGNGCMIPFDEIRIPDTLRGLLKGSNWTDRAIINLEKYIGTENKWDYYVEMNTKTGKIKYF